MSTMPERFPRQTAGRRQSGASRASPLLRVLAVLALSISALLCATDVDASGNIALGKHSYTLGSGDIIRIRVFEWPGFDGDIRIGPDGIVALHNIGTVKVRGLSTFDLSRLIKERLRRNSKLTEAPSVIVTIVRYRPFIVLGDVARPGEYEYRPDLTVMKAIGIAGGFFKTPRTSFERFEREVIVARSLVRTNNFAVQRGVIKLRRIETELRGKNTLELPLELAGDAKTPEIAALEEEEQKLLTINLALLRHEIATAEGTSRILREEIASLEQEFVSLDKQLAFVRKETQRMRSLASRKLTNATRLLVAERALTRVERERQALKTGIVRARREQHRADTGAAQLKILARKRLLDERQTTMNELKDVRLRLRRAEQLAIEAEISAPGNYKASLEQKTVRKISVIRKTTTGTQEVEATLLAEVQPGDVVRIVRIVANSEHRDKSIASGALTEPSTKPVSTGQ